MNLYLDTSSLLKLYLDEDGSRAVKALVGDSDVVATSLISYAEARSGLGRASRDGRLNAAAYRLVVEAFEAEWQTFVTNDVTDPLVHLAGDLAEKHGLRGLDAIHLASALTLRDEAAEPVTFSAADQRLMSAARTEGLLLTA